MAKYVQVESDSHKRLKKEIENDVPVTKNFVQERKAQEAKHHIKQRSRQREQKKEGRDRFLLLLLVVVVHRI